MGIATDTKKQIVKKHQRHDGDTGSAEVQIALLTTRVSELTEHLKDHQKDHSSRRGLLKMVGSRASLLKYVKKNDIDLIIRKAKHPFGCSGL